MTFSFTHLKSSQFYFNSSTESSFERGQQLKSFLELLAPGTKAKENVRLTRCTPVHLIPFKLRRYSFLSKKFHKT